MITTNIKSVIGEIDKFKLDVKTDVKATRDQLARAAQLAMKSELSKRQAYKGRGVNKKYESIVAGAPPAKQTGFLFRHIGTRKWNFNDKYGASVGLPKRSWAFYGKILETGTQKPGRGAPQHQWASPAFHKFEPLVNPIIAKNLGRVK